jgi:porin
LSAEAGYVIAVSDESNTSYFKAGLGAWYYTSPFEHLIEVDENGAALLTTGNSGVYGLLEGQVFREAIDPAQGLALFGRLGFANTRFNQLGAAWGAGLVYTGLLPHRAEDQMGLAFTTAQAGTPFLQSTGSAGPPLQSFETGIELTYRMPLNAWITIQPDIQYVINPGLETDTGRVWTIGHRFEITF